MPTVDDILLLLSRGFTPIGESTSKVSDGLSCRHGQAHTRWFAKNDVCICLGCGRVCVQKLPQRNMAAPAEEMASVKDHSGRVRVFIGDLPAVPDARILEVKELLYPQEASAILRVSKREVYAMVRDGRLDKANLAGAVRITSDSVRRRLQPESNWAA